MVQNIQLSDWHKPTAMGPFRCLALVPSRPTLESVSKDPPSLVVKILVKIVSLRGSNTAQEGLCVSVGFVLIVLGWVLLICICPLQMALVFREMAIGIMS